LHGYLSSRCLVECDYTLLEKGVKKRDAIMGNVGVEGKDTGRALGERVPEISGQVSAGLEADICPKRDC
jgi:hypothetical protein